MTHLTAAARGLALALLLLVGAVPAAAQPKFPALTGRVVDGAQMLAPATEQRLTAQLQQLETTTGRQLVVVTVPSLQGYEIEEYGYQLGRTWGIGRKDQDDGALFLVAPNERRVRIEVGYGLEGVLTDALSSVILQSRVLPQFRNGRMEQGVVDGVEAVVQQLSLPDGEARANVAQAAQAAANAQSSGGPGFTHLIVIALVVLWLFSGLGRRRRRGLWWLAPVILSGGGRGRGGGFGGGGFGGGGFGGGGGSFGGGGSSGSW
jgi:uncharacterized protein